MLVRGLIFSEEVQHLDVRNTLSVLLITSCTSRPACHLHTMYMHTVQPQNILVVITGKMVTEHVLKHMRNTAKPQRCTGCVPVPLHSVCVKLLILFLLFCRSFHSCTTAVNVWFSQETSGYTKAWCQNNCGF